MKKTGPFESNLIRMAMKSKGRNRRIRPTNATMRSKHHLKKNPMLCLFFSTLHGLHIENCPNTRQSYGFSEWVQQIDSNLHPPTVINGKLTICLAEVELLYHERLDV
jgi:hypothetical protein